jgi:hypothetical protein
MTSLPPARPHNLPRQSNVSFWAEPSQGQSQAGAERTSATGLMERGSVSSAPAPAARPIVVAELGFTGGVSAGGWDMFADPEV